MHHGFRIITDLLEGLNDYLDAHGLASVGELTGRALPAVRNTMPGVPGVGTVLDYAGFFWCLIAVAACLITAAITYIRAAFRTRHENQTN